MKEFLKIPGVGKTVANDLWDLGYRKIEDLKDENPEAMYERLLLLKKRKSCRCMLYVFRAAVYYASTQRPDPQKLDWWKWKD